MTNRKTVGEKNDQSPDPDIPEHPQPFCTSAAGYEIRVKNHLDTYWHDWFDGWSVTNLENGEVLLKSARVDQAKLHGTIIKIRDLNLTLLSVTVIPANR